MHAGLVGEAEREQGTRGGMPRSLSRAGARERAGVCPRGCQVGLLGCWGAGTRLLSGGEGRKGLRV
jgi:hypothetical protein